VNGLEACKKHNLFHIQFIWLVHHIGC